MPHVIVPFTFVTCLVAVEHDPCPAPPVHNPVPFVLVTVGVDHGAKAVQYPSGVAQLILDLREGWRKGVGAGGEGGGGEGADKGRRAMRGGED